MGGSTQIRRCRVGARPLASVRSGFSRLPARRGCQVVQEPSCPCGKVVSRGLRLVGRDRELAGGSRQGSYSRNVVWERQARWLGRFWPVALGIAAVPLVASLPLAFTRHGVARGAILGFAVATGLCV